ncbi:hypothetical protein PgNI_10756, partial [Pyricularia grisea]|uniref:Uncharacterized protein n=1 Tax=Pyricularia grisea TaxID=148305 RepID=A0A6P8AZI0_PYRGI
MKKKKSVECIEEFPMVRIMLTSRCFFCAKDLGLGRVALGGCPTKAQAASIP